MTLKLFKLDPAHYTIGLSWDVMLKITIVKLELVTDIDVNIAYFFKNNIRSGISSLCQKSDSE